MDNIAKRSSIIWSRQSTLKLIELLKLKPLLWLPGHENYLNRSKRMQAILDIALELHVLNICVTILDIRNKIHTLRSQYAREVKEILDGHDRFGKATKPSLWAFDELSFLWPVFAPNTEMPTFEEPVKYEDFNLEENDNNELNPTDSDDDMEEDYEESSSTHATIDVYSKEPNGIRIKWSRQLTRQLINLYKSHEVLWNPKHFSPENLTKRRKAVKKIARRMSMYIPHITSIEIQSKIRMLRYQYQSQVELLEMKKKEGIEILPKFWCFDLLSFLWPYYARQFHEINAIGYHVVGDDEDDINKDDNETLDDAEMETLDESISDSSYHIEAIEESNENSLENPSCKELENEAETEYIMATDDDLGFSNSNDDDNESVTHKDLDIPKCRYNWIGNYVLESLNDLENEDVIYDTVISIQNLLCKVREIDRKEKTTKAEKFNHLPQRRCNSIRPKQSDYNNFEVTFDLNQHGVNDVTVKVINQTIVIEGELGVGCDKDRKRFVRYYDLPNGYDVNSVEATQNEHGLLTVNATKLPCRNSKSGIELPIKQVSKSNLFQTK